MKSLFFTIALALVASTGQTQNIAYIEEPPTKDFVRHMKFCGYETMSFDISALRDSAQGFDIVLREYVRDSLVDERIQNRYQLKSMISDFPEEDQLEIREQKSGEDMERGIYKSVKTVTIGFTPATDSVERINIITDMACNYKVPLKMKYLCDKWRREPEFRYRAVAYSEFNYQPETFIPLVMYGSSWWDEKIQSYRFCGGMDPDGHLSFEKKSPHYYIIGIKFHDK